MDNSMAISIAARAVVCIAGIALNAILICASFNLGRPLNVCSMLIAADALTVCLYSASGPISLGIFIVAQRQLRLVDCLPFHVLPIIGFTLSRATIFCISLDRFFSVIFPLWYKNRNRSLYLCAFSFSSFIYLMANLLLIIQEDFRLAEVQVWCAMTDLFQGLNGPISQSIIGLNLLSVLFYAAMWAKLRQGRKRRKGEERKGAPNYTERMFKSLLAILLSILLGSVLVSAVKSLTTIVPFSPPIVSALNTGSSLLSVLNSGCHPIILYVFSKEYRMAINRLFTASSGTGSTIMAANSEAIQSLSLARSQRQKNGTGAMVKVGG